MERLEDSGIGAPYLPTYESLVGTLPTSVEDTVVRHASSNMIGAPSLAMSRDGAIF